MMLTPKQRDLLLYLQRYIDRARCAPSYEEMQTDQGLASKSGILRILIALEERGFIRRIPHRQRAIEILKRVTDPEAAPISDAAREAYRVALKQIAEPRADDSMYDLKVIAQRTLERFP